MKFLKLIFIVFLSLFLACKKDSEESQSKVTVKPKKKIVQARLLNKMPDEALGFVHIDFRTKGAKSYLNSNFGKSYEKLIKSYQKKFEELSRKHGEKNEFITAFGNIQDIIMPTNKNSMQGVAEEVFFILPPPETGAEKTLIGALYASAGEDYSFGPVKEEVLAELKKAATSNRMLGDELYEFDMLLGKQPNPHNLKLYVAVNDKFFSVSNDMNLALSVFSEAKNTLPRILKTDAYKYYQSKHDFPASQQYALGFFEVEKLLAYLPIPANKLKDFPVQDFFTIGAHDQLAYGKFLVRTKEASPIKGVSTKVDEMLPGGSALDVFFNANVNLDNKKHPKMPELPEDIRKLLDCDLGFALGIKDFANVYIPYPEVYIILECDTLKTQKEVLVNKIKQSLGMAVPSPAGQSPWQKKQVVGKDVEFMMTPFGVGIFIASDENRLIVATGEESIKAIFSKQVEPKPGNTFGGIRLNFTEVANIINKVQGAFAMYTGGQNPFDPQLLEDLRALGRFEIEVKEQEPQLYALDFKMG